MGYCSQDWLQLLPQVAPGVVELASSALTQTRSQNILFSPKWISVQRGYSGGRRVVKGAKPQRFYSTNVVNSGQEHQGLAVVCKVLFLNSCLA